MTSLATKAAKRLVMQHARVYEPEDPFYEFWTEPNGKQKRRKRPPPPGLTKEEAQLLRKIARRAHYLDKGFEICGFRFGWTAIIGLIPGAGDIADALLNYTLVLRPSAKGANLPPWIVTKMWLNNGVSAGVGLVPIAGDMILAIYKANSRNAKLLEEYLRILGEEHIAAGLPNLTPEPTPLPGQPVGKGRGREESHPAQPAAKQLVKDHSQQQLNAPAGNSHSQTTAVNSGQAVSAPLESGQSTSNSRFWNRKK